MKITLKQRRFLIVWIVFHITILTFNIIPLKGLFEGDEAIIPNNRGYVFTNGYNQFEGFWPFIQFYREYQYFDIGTFHIFRGVFAGYDISEFIVYTLIGFAIVFLPKFWNENKLSNN